MSYRGWSLGSPSQSSAAIAEAAAMQYEPTALAFVDISDITPEMNFADRSSAAITIDERSSATSENIAGGGSPRALRRVARRPNPVVVPNLTKKARGRPVPTKDTPLKPGSGRAYTCMVEDCLKVFTRAEHLKRHTRSIHTNEKRESDCLNVRMSGNIIIDHLSWQSSSIQVRRAQLRQVVHPA